MVRPPYTMVDYVWFRIAGQVKHAPMPFYLGRGMAYDRRYDSRTNPQSARPGYFVFKVAMSRGGRWGVGERTGELLPGQGVLRSWSERECWDSYAPGAREPWEFLGLIFAGEAAAAFARGLIDKYGPIHDFPMDSVLGRYLLRLAADPTHHVELSASDAARLVNDTLAALLQSAEQRQRTRHRLDLAQAVERYIVEHFSMDVSIADLARRYDVSREHLTRLFTQEFGIAPHRYLLDIRMREACRLLRTTNRAVKQIFTEVGFESRVTFLRAFRRVVGVTPSEYRKGHPSTGFTSSI